MGSENSKSKESELDFASEFLEDNSHKKMEEKMKDAYHLSLVGRQMQITNSEHQNYEDSETIVFTEHDFRLSKESKKSQNDVEHDEFTLTGVLEKQSPSILGSWSERYCILTKKRFIYYEKQHKNSPEAGILNFDLLNCYTSFQEKDKKLASFKLGIESSEKEFVFRGKDFKVTRQWGQRMKYVTDISLGRKHNLTYLSHYHRFWRKNYFSEKEFRETSQTGDLILMRGKHKSAVLQRAITQEQFDHVAIILKNMRDSVLLFEAKGGTGVGIVPWQKFIKRKWFKDQEIVVFRSLKVQRTPEFYSEIEQFVERNMGRRYKFSVKSYMINRTSTSEDKSSYFCSSLVAKLYKNLQLLSPGKSSTQYLPHNFSQKEALNLRKNGKFGNAFLDREKIIVFESKFFGE